MNIPTLTDTYAAPATGVAANPPGTVLSMALVVTGTGTVSATVVVEASNDGGSNWFTLATLSASGGSPVSDSLVGESSWVQIRSRCTAIAGTNASASVRVSAGS